MFTRSIGIAVVLDSVTDTAPPTVVGLAVAVGEVVAVGVAVGEVIVGVGVGVGVGAALLELGDGFGVADFDVDLLGFAVVASDELLPEHAASASTPAVATATTASERRTVTSKDEQRPFRLPATSA